jgi:hypothetical protein
MDVGSGEPEINQKISTREVMVKETWSGFYSGGWEL